MRVRALTAETAAGWFGALGIAPGTAQMAQLRELLDATPLQPHLRTVIERGGRAFGRFAAERRGDAIRVWIPAFRPETSGHDRKAAMRACIDDVLARRAAGGCDDVPLDAPAGDDEADGPLWIESLREARFAEISAFRVYVLSSLGVARGGAPSGVRIRAATRDDLGALPELYRRCYSDTLDRRPRALAGAEHYIDELRSFGAGFDPALWLTAAVAGERAGFVLVNGAREAAFPGLSAWVLEIGCLPQHRGKGIAGALLAAVVPPLGKTGAQRLLATIDDINTPSIRLHKSFGFRAQPDRHYIFRHTA